MDKERIQAELDGKPPTPIRNLSPAETQVMELIAKGLENEAIADHLGVSEKTVLYHSMSIYVKFGVSEVRGTGLNPRVLAVVRYLNQPKKRKRA